MAASGLPHCLEARPGCRAAAKAIAERRGLVAEPDIPLMAAVGPVEGPRPDALVFRQLQPAEASLHCEVAGPAFGAAPDMLAGLITPSVLELPEVRGYVGEVRGEAVVTAMSVTLEDAVGIFNVATVPPYRRRGYGAAATARVLNEVSKPARPGAGCSPPRRATASTRGWDSLRSSPGPAGSHDRDRLAATPSRGLMVALLMFTRP